MKKNFVILLTLIPLFTFIIIGLIFSMKEIKSPLEEPEMIGYGIEVQRPEETGESFGALENVTEAINVTNRMMDERIDFSINLLFALSLFSTVFFASIIILIILGFLLFLRERAGKYAFFEKRKIDEGFELLKEELKATIDDLVLSYKDINLLGPKGYILKCYKAVCNFLEKYGVDNPKYLTAREFENHIYKLINYKSKNFHELTLLFEKAKYGYEEIDNKKAVYAKELLEKIKKELKK